LDIAALDSHHATASRRADGGRATFDGRHGSIKPEGRRRWTIAGG